MAACLAKRYIPNIIELKPLKGTTKRRTAEVIRSTGGSMEAGFTETTNTHQQDKTE
jgi:hypothetical protein